MATKAAKSITINATKYELANALAVNDGKVQLKAKDVLLDEAELPAGSKYAIFDFGFEIDGFKSCKDQDGNDVLTSGALKDIVEAGGDVYFKYTARKNGVLHTYIDRFERYEQYIAGDEVKIEMTYVTSPDNETTRKLTAIGTFSVDAPTVSTITAPSVKITKCKVLAPSGYAKGFLEAMAVNDSVTCTIPSGFPKKVEIDSGLVYGGIQGADLVINDSNDTNGLYIVPLQLVHAGGGTEPRYAYFTLYDGKVFRTVLSTGGGTNQWDITRIA